MDDLRILVYSNPLVVNKISKKFLYWRDSGFIFSKNLISSFPESYRIYWVIPDDIKDTGWFLDANRNIELINYPYSTSIHQNRYEFYGKIFRDCFPYTKDVDVIISNQPEVSANLRVWAYNQRRDLPIIYSFFHWIDCEDSRQFAQQLGGYFWREYDGALHSDAVYLHRGHGEELFRIEMQRLGLETKNINIRPYTPPYTKFGSVPMDLPDKKIIMFNHRLNNTTNWKDVLDICTKLHEKRDDFVLWFTDEGRNLKELSALDDYPFLIVKEIPDENYGYVLSKSHISICNHRGYSTWNMAVLDAVMNGCFTLVPYDSVYPDMFGGVGVDIGMYHNFDDLGNRVNMLLSTAQWELESRLIEVQKWVERRLLIPLSSIKDDFVRDIKSRVRKKPKKYDDVKTMILEQSETHKKEWVNKFWSFHVNSNFQLIRWNLLSDGIHDDTSESETLYRGKND